MSLKFSTFLPDYLLQGKNNYFILHFLLYKSLLSDIIMVDMTKQTDIAWAAGVFDGEGCIYIGRRLANSRPNILTDFFILSIKVTMGHINTLRRLHRIFGVGNVFMSLPRSRTRNALYSWVVIARNAEKILRLMQPHLTTKSKEVKIAFAFFALRPHYARSGRFNTLKSPSEVDRRLRYYWKLRMAKPSWRSYRRRLHPKERREITRLGLKVSGES